jgi:hypothetical protein
VPEPELTHRSRQVTHILAVLLLAYEGNRLRLAGTQTFKPRLTGPDVIESVVPNFLDLKPLVARNGQFREFRNIRLRKMYL